jgi:hypothetical protein
MGRTVTQVGGLGKRYPSARARSYTALRHLIGDALQRRVRLLTVLRVCCSSVGLASVHRKNSYSRRARSGEIWCQLFLPSM